MPTEAINGGTNTKSLQDRREAIAWLEAQRSILVAAAGQAADLHGDLEVASYAWRLADALAPFFDNGKYIIDWQTASQAGLRAARRVDDREAEAQMLKRLGVVHAQLLQPEQAIRCFERSLEIFRELGNRRGAGEGWVFSNLAGAYMQIGRIDDVMSCLAQSLEIFRDRRPIWRGNHTEQYWLRLHRGTQLRHRNWLS